MKLSAAALLAAHTSVITNFLSAMVYVTTPKRIGTFSRTVSSFLQSCARPTVTHATAIPACKGTYQTYFDNQAIYKEFYQVVCQLIQISIMEAGFHLQNLLVYWLRDKGEGRAASWFEQYWTCEGKG